MVPGKRGSQRESFAPAYGSAHEGYDVKGNLEVGSLIPGSDAGRENGTHNTGQRAGIQQQQQQRGQPLRNPRNVRGQPRLNGTYRGFNSQQNLRYGVQRLDEPMKVTEARGQDRNTVLRAGARPSPPTDSRFAPPSMAPWDLGY